MLDGLMFLLEPSAEYGFCQRHNMKCFRTYYDYILSPQYIFMTNMNKRYNREWFIDSACTMPMFLYNKQMGNFNSNISSTELILQI